jgi:hypothetical protein
MRKFLCEMIVPLQFHLAFSADILASCYIPPSDIDGDDDDDEVILVETKSAGVCHSAIEISDR